MNIDYGMSNVEDECLISNDEYRASIIVPVFVANFTVGDLAQAGISKGLSRRVFRLDNMG